MPRYLSAAVLGLWLVASPAMAETGAGDMPVFAYHCAHGFTLEQTDEGLQLTGVLDTPTPGWRALYVPEVKGISLIPPQGMVVKALSTVDVDLVLPFDVVDPDGKVEIELEKPYGWGIPAISCTRADQPPPQ